MHGGHNARGHTGLISCSPGIIKYCRKRTWAHTLSSFWVVCVCSQFFVYSLVCWRLSLLLLHPKCSFDRSVRSESASLTWLGKIWGHRLSIFRLEKKSVSCKKRARCIVKVHEYFTLVSIKGWKFYAYRSTCVLGKMPISSSEGAWLACNSWEHTVALPRSLFSPRLRLVPLLFDLTNFGPCWSCPQNNNPCVTVYEVCFKFSDYVAVLENGRMRYFDFPFCSVLALCL